MPSLLCLGRKHAGISKLRIGEDHLNVRALRPFPVAVAARILRRDPCLDVRVMHDHPHGSHISRCENVLPTFHPHVIANVERASLVSGQAQRFDAQIIERGLPAGGEKNFLHRDGRQFLSALRFHDELARCRARNVRNAPVCQDADAFLFVNRSESFAKLRGILGQQPAAGEQCHARAQPCVTERKLRADRAGADDCE